MIVIIYTNLVDLKDLLHGQFFILKDGFIPLFIHSSGIVNIVIFSNNTDSTTLLILDPKKLMATYTLNIVSMSH